MTNSCWTRVAAVAAIAIGILLFLLLLLSLPIADFVGELQKHDLVRALVTRRKYLYLALGVGLLGSGFWLVARRRLRLMRIGGALLFPLLLVLAVYEFQMRFPHAGIHSLERHGDSLRVLLGKDAALSRYAPVSTLKLDNREVLRAKFPVIDVHFHLDSLSPTIDADRLVQAMDSMGVAQIVNLDGRAAAFERHAASIFAKYPDRVILFAKPDPGALQNQGGAEADLEWIKQAIRRGASGLKEAKSLGLGQKDSTGKLVPVDDERLAPLWNLAGELGIPLLIHTGEPASFWDPVDVHNERYLELLVNSWFSLHGPDKPSRDELRRQRERLLARHPNTNFIGAHFGMDPDDLGYVARLLDTYPNYYVDMSSVVQELGRQPYSAREFFIRYQDRILFGTDGGFGLTLDPGGWSVERMYRSYFEFLETDNEYISYPLSDLTKQGTWRVYGINLPDDVLQKVYFRNAEKLIPAQAEIVKRLEALESPG